MTKENDVGTQNRSVKTDDSPHLRMAMSLGAAIDGETDADRLPYAVAADGRTLFWDLCPTAGTPHFLAEGPIGSGRTSLLRRLVLGAAQRSRQVLICDSLRTEYPDLDRWPTVQIASTVTDIVAAIDDTHTEMERRYRAMESGEAGNFDPLHLVVDSYNRLRPHLEKGRRALGERPRTVTQLREIALMGRSARVHLLLGTENDGLEDFGGALRDQFQARCTLGGEVRPNSLLVGLVPGAGIARDDLGRSVECQVIPGPLPGDGAGAE